MNDSLENYNKVLQLLYLGKYEEASQFLKSCRDVENHSPEFTTIRKLLVFRLAIKSGNLDIDMDSLDADLESNVALKAEISAVKGLYCFQKGEMEKGQTFFLDAIKYFQITGNQEKELICTYNYLIAETHKSFRNNQVQLLQFKSLLNLAIECKNNKLVGIVYRQISYIYKEEEAFHQAIEFGLKAVNYLGPHGSTSDYHLALIHLIELNLELNQISDAEALLKKLQPPFDQRTLFPLMYVQTRLGVHLFKIGISLDDLRSQSCPHFVERFELWKAKGAIKSLGRLSKESTFESINESVLESAPESATQSSFHFSAQKSPPTDLEFRLLKTLAQGPQSKNLLIEKLWPDFAQSDLVNNRFHRLLNRISKKFGRLIEFNDGFYKLNQNNAALPQSYLKNQT